MRIALSRTRAHAALFSSIAGVVLVACTFGVGITGYLGVSALSGTRAALATATGADGAIRVEADLGDKPTAQDVAARRTIATATTAPLDIDRSLFGSGLDSSAGPLDVASFVGLPNRASLVAGAWPSSASQASIEASAAAIAHLAVGDTVTLGSTKLTITATWRQTHALAPVWFGSALSADGSDSAEEGDVGPLVVDESVWSSLDASPAVRWTIVPHAASVQPDDLASLESLDATLTRRMPDIAAIASNGVVVSGDLGTTAAAARSALAAVGGVSPVPLLLVIVVSFVTLFELSRLLLSVRAGETALLRSRGASAAFVARDSAVEAAFVAVPAAVLGAIAGALVVVATTGSLPGAASVLLFPAATAVVVVVLASLAAWSSARRALRRDSANDSGRARSVAAAGLVVVVVAAAAFTVWQFLLYGSPLVKQSTGEYATDPVAVLAAPLALLALATIALALFPLVARLLESLASRSLGLVRVLSARQLSRRITVFATPVLVLTLAIGGVVLASGYSATWSTTTTTTRALRTGTDVRVEQPEEAAIPISTAAHLAGVTSVEPVLSAGTTLGEDDVSLLASDSEPNTTGVALPNGSTTATLTVTVDRPRQPQVDVAVWLMDEHGQLDRVPLSTTADPSSPQGTSRQGFYSGTMPDGSWRVVAVDIRLLGALNFTGMADSFTVQLGRLAFDDGPTPLTGWALQQGLTFDGTVAPSGSALGATGTISSTGPITLRFMPGARSKTIPVQVSSSLAARADLSEGDPVSLAFSDEGRTVNGRVRSIVPAVPGMTGDYGVHAGLGDLELQQLRTTPTVPDPDELWLSSTSPSASVAALRRVGGASVAVATEESDAATPVLGTARVALWAGAIGALLLAIVTVSAVAGAMIRARSSEVVVLTAVGLTARDQASARRRELAVLVVFAGAVGLAGGVLVSRLLVAGLARSTVLDPIAGLPVPLRFDAIGLLGSLAGLVVAIIALVVVYAGRVARQVRTLSAREEVR